MDEIFPTICEDCGKLFQAKSKKAWFCKACVSKRLSVAAKTRGLNKLGNDAYSEQRAILNRRADNG